MKKHAKITALFVLCLCFALSFSVSAKKTYPKPTDDFFVNDFANVLTDRDKQEMQKLGEALYEKTKAQVVVVTVPSMKGEDVEDYAYHLAKEWGIGDKDDDSGVLLLLSMEERKIRVEVGSGLEGQLTDGKTGRILDNYAMPALREGDYSEGLKKAYWALVNETYHEFGMEMDEDYVPADELRGNRNERNTRTSSLKTAITVFIVLAVLIVLRRHGIIVWGFPFGGGGFSGGGGGFSSGGGGFSGGGGGFSGGGASRDF